MNAVRQKFSSQADPRLLGELRAIAREEGRQFQAVLEQALREFVERKIISDDSLAEAAKSKLQGGDPIAEFLGNCIDDDITLDDNTRVIAWFDN